MQRQLDIVTSSISAICAALLVTFEIATQLSPDGSSLHDGYLGNNGSINLNNIAVVLLIVLVVSIVLNQIVIRKRSRLTRIVNKVGLIIICAVGVWALIIAFTLILGVITHKF